MVFKEIKNLCNGPYKNEAEFKAALIKQFAKIYPNVTIFQIENEEKEPGMPDILFCSNHSPSVWTEVKISDKNGRIEFQPSQPLWYKKHHQTQNIQILAWDVRFKRVVAMYPEDIVSLKKTSFQLPGENDITLFVDAHVLRSSDE